MKYFFVLILFFFIASCTETPVKKKVISEKVTDTKLERVTFEEKAEFKNIELNIIQGHLFEKHLNFSKDKMKDGFINGFDDTKLNEEKKHRNLILLEANLFLEAPIYEIETEYIEKITQTKKLSQYSYNPIGAFSVSVLMFGTIEAWCLLEWASHALPGEQKDIYLKDCKEFYLGNKTEKSETISRESSVTDTGEIEIISKPINNGKLRIYANNLLIQTIAYKDFTKPIYISDFLEDLPGVHELLQTRSMRMKIEVEISYKGEKITKISRFILPKKVIDYEIQLNK